jgi:DNA-binding XRE family transcriptional regulator
MPDQLALTEPEPSPLSGADLRTMHRGAGLTQQQLAERFGCDRTAIVRWEQGQCYCAGRRRAASPSLTTCARSCCSPLPRRRPSVARWTRRSGAASRRVQGHAPDHPPRTVCVRRFRCCSRTCYMRWWTLTAEMRMAVSPSTTIQESAGSRTDELLGFPWAPILPSRRCTLRAPAVGGALGCPTPRA